MEYTLLNGTPIGRSVVVGSVRHGPSNYAELADNGDILEVAIPPDLTAAQTMDWGSGSVVGGKWQRFTVRNKTDAELLAEVRGKRTELLLETDYFALSDVTMSSDMTNYRKALRDLPATVDLTDIVYPTKP
jgi:hypothetical protein